MPGLGLKRSEIRKGIFFGVPPNVAILTPAPGTLLPVATTATFTGTCDVDVDSLQFFYGGALIGTGTQVAGVWSFKWSPGLRRAGSADFVARAIRHGLGGDSSPVSITVDNIPLRASFGATGACWCADDVSGPDGTIATGWASRINSHTITTAAGFLLNDGWVTPNRGNRKVVGVRVATANSHLSCDTLAPIFQGTNPAITVILVGQVPAGLGSGTQMLFTATSHASSTPKWLYQHVSTPAAQKLSKQTTTLTFSSAASSRVDFGQHMYVGVDTGVAMNVWRDTGCIMASVPTQALDVADAAITRVNFGVQNNAGALVNPADFNYRWMLVLPTASLVQADFQYILRFCMGNFDDDQFYGDSSTAHEINVQTGQSNEQGLAITTLEQDPGDPSILINLYSNNNWVEDNGALETLLPQGSGPYIGYWYQSLISRKAVAGVPVSLCMVGSGAQFINTFRQFIDDGYWGSGLFDVLCRKLEESRCWLGGTPSYRFTLGQGESDAQIAAVAANYLTDLTAYVSEVRALLGATTPTAIIQLNGTSPGQPFAATVQAAQSTWVSGDAHAALIPTTDYVFPTGFISALHWNRDAQIVIGDRAGSAVIP